MSRNWLVRSVRWKVFLQHWVPRWWRIQLPLWSLLLLPWWRRLFIFGIQMKSSGSSGSGCGMGLRKSLFRCGRRFRRFWFLHGTESGIPFLLWWTGLRIRFLVLSMPWGQESRALFWLFIIPSGVGWEMCKNARGVDLTVGIGAALKDVLGDQKGQQGGWWSRFIWEISFWMK